MRIPPRSYWNQTVDLLKKLSREASLKMLWESSFLVGGTALSLQIKHRISYDLDFAWTASSTLPWRTLIRTLEEFFRKSGLSFKRIYRQDIDLDLLVAGFYPEEQYLFYLIVQEDQETKLEIWIPDSQAFLETFNAQKENIHYGFVRLASVETIFDLKVLTLPRRCTWRDLYDLWFLVQSSNFPTLSPERILETLQKYYSDATVDSVLMRLKKLKMEHLGDQGFFLYNGTIPNWKKLFQSFKEDLIAELRKTWKKKNQKALRSLRSSFSPK